MQKHFQIKFIDNVVSLSWYQSTHSHTHIQQPVKPVKPKPNGLLQYLYSPFFKLGAIARTAQIAHLFARGQLADA